MVGITNKDCTYKLTFNGMEMDFLNRVFPDRGYFMTYCMGRNIEGVFFV